jgi:hypothetical protein
MFSSNVSDDGQLTRGINYATLDAEIEKQKKDKEDK